jgi:serine/threonine-protein kinase
MPDERPGRQTEVLSPGETAADRGELRSGERVGEFEIEARIGKGGMGVVYRAFQPILQRRVAIKVLSNLGSADAVERFMREARSAARVRHPAIPEIHTFGTLPSGHRYYVMELLEGETLRDLLKRTRIEPPRAIHIVEQVADALRAAHEIGIIHRDLKPENIFLANAPSAPFGVEVKLLDFGIAKPLEAENDLRLSSVGVILGTPVYMPPEQMLDGTISPRSDVYALACVAYEMLAGSRPFDQRQTEELLRAKMLGAPPPITVFGPELAPFAEPIEIGLSPSSAARYSTAPELAEAMRDALEQPTRPMATRSLASALIAPRRRASTWWVIAAAAAAGIAAIVLGASLPAKGDEPVAPVIIQVAPPPAEPVVRPEPPPPPPVEVKVEAPAKRPKKRAASRATKDNLLPDMPIRF